MKGLLEIAGQMPELNVSILAENEEYLRKLDSPATNKQLATLSILTSIATFPLAYLTFTLVLTNTSTATTTALLASLAAFYLLATLPKRIYKHKIQVIEAELSILLRSIAVELTSGSKFENAIANTSKLHNGPASIELRKTLNAITNGKSVPAALREYSQKWNSPNIQRATSQLIFTYEHGSNAANSLKKLSDELMLIQKTQSKKHASKMAMGGLIFTAASAITPALFSAYTIIGSSFLEITMTPLQITAIFLIAFPLINTAILYYLHASAPVTITQK